MEPISKKLSCGVIVLSQGKVLIQHVTNQSHWDIPKGTQSQGETTSETAIRELFEETGIRVNESDLIDLGWFAYNRFKDLYLYVVKIDDLDINELDCNSFFEDEDGVKHAEADEYKLVTPSLMGDYVCGSLRRLLEAELLCDIKREL